MLPTKKTKFSQDILSVILIGAVLMTGIIMIVFSALNNSSFRAILGVSVAFWSVLLLFFTPTKHTFLSLLKASASAGGSNIERSLIEFNSEEKGVYLPPQNLRNFESSLILYLKQTGRICLHLMKQTISCSLRKRTVCSLPLQDLLFLWYLNRNSACLSEKLVSHKFR